MRELTDIELVMFGKNKKLGLKRRNSEVIQNAFITESFAAMLGKHLTLVCPFKSAFLFS